MSGVPLAVAVVAAATLVPGALFGLVIGLRREAWAGTIGLLSLGQLALSIVVASTLHVRWGPMPVVGTTAALCAVAGLWRLSVRYVWPRVRSRVRILREHPLDEVSAVRPRYPWASLALAASAGAGVVWVIVHGMDGIGNPQQVYDAAFHVNAVQRVALEGSASPAIVASTPSLGAVAGGYYPPLFHAVAALAVVVAGVDPVVAANVTAIVTAGVLWPLAMAWCVASMTPRRLLGWVMAAIAMVTVPASPYLFLSFGVLWPNALGMATVPAALVLVARVLGRVPSHDPTLTVTRALVAGLVGACGLYYAHPNAIFAVVALGLPIFVAFLGRELSRLAHARGPLVALVAGIAAVAALVLLVRALWSMPILAAVRAYDWPAVMSTQQALGEALTLAIGDVAPVWVIGIVVALGAVVAFRHRVTSWMAVSYALACYLYVLAAGNDDPISNNLTGFWYNDRWRVGSLVLVLVPPLAALGALRAVDGLRAYVVDRFALGSRVSSGVGVVLAGLAIALVLYSMPRNDGLHDPEATIARGYHPPIASNLMLTPGQNDLFATLKARGGTERVVGDPYSGEVYAGVLSGRQAVFPHFSGALSSDQVLVRDHFAQYRSRPDVCRAVKRLRIGYAVGNTRLYWNGTDHPDIFPGVRQLEGVDGLSVIARAGTATLYSVAPCSG